MCVFCHQNTFIKIKSESAFELFDIWARLQMQKNGAKNKESRVNWHPITLQSSVILVWAAANNEEHENHLKNDEERKGEKRKKKETNHQPTSVRKSQKITERLPIKNR